MDTLMECTPAEASAQAPAPATTSAVATRPPAISQVLAAFVGNCAAGDIPPPVLESTKLLLLDAVGLALAASRFEFARVARDALSTFGGGDTPVIGFPDRLALRDAAMLNGTLVHGLDFDDTYLPGSMHLTSSCVPAALAMAHKTGASGRDFLTALALGIEAGARLAHAGHGGFIRNGFHATSVLGTMACTLIAGRLGGLDTQQLVLAQGVALSMASGTMQTVSEGTWTKRLHPGWAASAGISAAAFGKAGFTGPVECYEGRYGIFNNFLGSYQTGAEPALATAGLGEDWQLTRASFKLYPCCHQMQAFLDAGTALRRDYAPALDDITGITALVAPASVPVICEPMDERKAPSSSYAAQFSLPYGIACSLARGGYTLEETREHAYTDPTLRRLAGMVAYEIDPHSGFPAFRTGEVHLHMRDGRVLKQRCELLPDKPASAQQIVAKFRANLAPSLPAARIEQLLDLLLHIEQAGDMRAVAAQLAGEA